ncbi:hypothetical protein Tco_1003445 [Tanacetum coccineum]|uniref:Uncharacterized protein n=1 Tax=Tanacetum coccineum TaxID=301880 RepID=A0ABQ5F9H2_9ASTR
MRSKSLGASFQSRPLPVGGESSSCRPSRLCLWRLYGVGAVPRGGVAIAGGGMMKTDYSRVLGASRGLLSRSVSELWRSLLLSLA